MQTDRELETGYETVTGSPVRIATVDSDRLCGQAKTLLVRTDSAGRDRLCNQGRVLEMRPNPIDMDGLCTQEQSCK